MACSRMEAAWSSSEFGAWGSMGPAATWSKSCHFCPCMGIRCTCSGPFGRSVPSRSAHECQLRILSHFSTLFCHVAPSDLPPLASYREKHVHALLFALHRMAEPNGPLNYPHGWFPRDASPVHRSPFTVPVTLIWGCVPSTIRCAWQIYYGDLCPLTRCTCLNRSGNPGVMSCWDRTPSTRRMRTTPLLGQWQNEGEPQEYYFPVPISGQVQSFHGMWYVPGSNFVQQCIPSAWALPPWTVDLRMIGQGPVRV